MKPLVPILCFGNAVRLGGAGIMLAASTSAIGQTLGQGSDDGTSLWRVLSAFILCSLLALLGAWAIKTRFHGKASLPAWFKFPTSDRPERRLLLRETLRLNPHTNLSIVSCDGRELLIATSGSDVKLLEALPASNDKAAGVPSDSSL